jgi:hypothetical protein
MNPLRVRNNTTLRNEIKKKGRNEISISDFIGTSKASLGIPNYTSPSTEMHFRKPTQGKISKSKNLSFAEGIMA